MKKRLRSSKVLKFFSSVVFKLRVFRTPALQNSRTSSMFTMVEITMAVAIIGIGMAGVMALLPIGFNATRDAMGDNYSSNMADQFLHVIAMKAKKDWSIWINNSDVTGTIRSTTAAVPEPPNPLYNTSGYLFGNDGNNHDEFGLYTTSAQGVYYAEAVSGSSINPIKDFTAHITIWKSNITTFAYVKLPTELGWKSHTFPYTEGVGLNMEISWPAEKPYARREKRYYYLEVFAPK